VTVATGVGSMPGEEFAQSVRSVLDQLPDLPHLPELPARGATASMTGRGLAVMSGLGADLQPAGWRLTDAPGIDHRRARSLLAQDLDTLEELTQGYSGELKIQVAGPWTLAATVEKPRGDKVLADYGARRELAQALAEGLTTHIADVRRRVSGATTLLVQVDEPALPGVLAARVPTASGFGRHRAVHPPEASAALEWVLDAIAAAGAVPVVHCCAPDVPIELLRGAGAAGLSVDLTTLAMAGYDALAAALEAGERVLFGVVPAVDPEPVPSDTQATELVLRWLDMLGLDPAKVGAQLVVTPTCGLAGASSSWARHALGLVRTVAANLAD